MKLLLTDSGVRNASMLAALVGLLGKPIAEADALCIPTAGYGGPFGDPGGPWRFISGRSPSPMTELGWRSVGVLELASPSWSSPCRGRSMSPGPKRSSPAPGVR